MPEVYLMFHLPTSKPYVGMAYRGAYQRLQTHWRARFRERDPCHLLMEKSAAPLEWVMWPIEQFPSSKGKGYQSFHRRAAQAEGEWASRLATWWPRGLNIASTGRARKPLTRAHWNRKREQLQREARLAAEQTRKAGEIKIAKMVERLVKGCQVKEIVRELSLEEKKAILQHLYMSKESIRGPRSRLEMALRAAVHAERQKRKKPDGDFVKVLIASSVARSLRLGSILITPCISQKHPIPEEAEQLWICERNVAPLSQVLINVQKVADETPDPGEEVREGNEDDIVTACSCMSQVRDVTPEDTWKGHLCTAEMRRFKSPIIRAALRKGHKFKVDLGVESLRTEIDEGLSKYINYWAGKRKASQRALEQLEDWKRAVLDAVQRTLSKEWHALYPKGNNLQREADRLGKSIVFMKEDRAPHVIVAMCKKLYTQELNKEMQSQETFEDVKETENEILARHRLFQISRGLEANERLPYPYGIWKSAKRKMRIISVVKKTMADKVKRFREEPIQRAPEGARDVAGSESTRSL